MDHDQVADVLRCLRAGHSRRDALIRVSVGLLTFLAPRLGGQEAVAAKRRAHHVAKKGKTKSCPPCMTRKKGKCKATLPDGTVCSGGMCQGGRCVGVSSPPPPPDPCALCTGDEVCRGGTCLVPACGAGGPCRVFLSSSRYTGALGGLTGADAKCQSLATTAGLPGTYRAWLSDNTSSPSLRFTPSSGPYRLVNGTTIAANWAELIDGSLDAPITVTETGGAPSGLAHVWTDTRGKGTITVSSGHCANWSTNAGASGRVGSAQTSNGSWTDVELLLPCSELHHLYCFQQG